MSDIITVRRLGVQEAAASVEALVSWPLIHRMLPRRANAANSKR